MTQKELAYTDDAIEHERNIILICEDTVEKLEDENLIKFLNDELKIHRKTKEKLMNILEVKANE